MEHTPGPWKANFYHKMSDPAGKAPEIWSDGMLICKIPGVAYFDYANARLIASSTDLLKALTELYDHTKNDYQIAALNIQAKNAIDKAIGKE
jgi:hypothetical protein